MEHPPDFSKKNLPPFLMGRWRSPLERGDLGVCKTQRRKTTLPPIKGGGLGGCKNLKTDK